MRPVRLILGHVQQAIRRNILRCFASVDYSPAHSREKVNLAHIDTKALEILRDLHVLGVDPVSIMAIRSFPSNRFLNVFGTLTVLLVHSPNNMFWYFDIHTFCAKKEATQILILQGPAEHGKRKNHTTKLWLGSRTFRASTKYIKRSWREASNT